MSELSSARFRVYVPPQATGVNALHESVTLVALKQFVVHEGLDGVVFLPGQQPIIFLIY